MGETTTCETAIPAERARAIKSRQQAMWASADFAVIGTTLQIVGELLAEAADVRSLHTVLDVAAGNGNATLAAARRFAAVTSTDYVPAFLERARRRAAADNLDNVRFEVADVEALPYSDSSFDVVLSTVGVMFAPDHAQSAREMMRVSRPGGRIGLASWTPTGFVGQFFKVITKYVPPPAGASSPLLWGTEAHIAELFPNAAAIEHNVREFAFRYRSPEHWVQVFRSFYGPIHKAFLSLDADGQAQMEADLIALLRHLDAGGGAGLVVWGEYLESVITK